MPIRPFEVIQVEETARCAQCRTPDHRSHNGTPMRSSFTGDNSGNEH
ncbi:hypothetical protein RRSWK_00986 [Rhodopirellula sp. SWK7]|nr:hypothetical protein RRSWK_00986 [Rhodopirellula sp. SWK7]